MIHGPEQFALSIKAFEKREVLQALTHRERGMVRAARQSLRE